MNSDLDKSYILWQLMSKLFSYNAAPRYNRFRAPTGPTALYLSSDGPLQTRVYLVKVFDKVYFVSKWYAGKWKIVLADASLTHGRLVTERGGAASGEGSTINKLVHKPSEGLLIYEFPMLVKDIIDYTE